MQRVIHAYVHYVVINDIVVIIVIYNFNNFDLLFSDFRLLHSVDALDSANNCEIKLEGEGEWNPDSNLDIIHTPVLLSIICYFVN